MKVSVILPVYGVAQYIEKCVQSLLAQTLDDMEFLFVDDHGPDNSIELLQKAIAGSERGDQFRILRPPHNLGAGMARNFAIPEAKGEYIAFVDSDDWVEPTMYEELYGEAKRQDNAEICFCQIMKDYTDGKPSETMSNPSVAAGTFTHDKRAFFLANYVSIFTSYLYRRDLVERHNIRFPEERSADDSFFVSSILLTARSVAHVDKPFYHYIVRPGSVVTTKNSAKYQKRLSVFGHLMQFAKDSGAYGEYKAEVDFLYIKKGCLSSVFNYVYNASESERQPVLEIMAELERQVPDYRENQYYRSRWAVRVLVWLCQKHPRMALCIIALYLKRAHPAV
ncbi:MAG: glycosyltransferase [Bacteroidales bacterium]|nr:glycosyltransferase [Bacteroidales bacterium]